MVMYKERNPELFTECTCTTEILMLVLVWEWTLTYDFEYVLTCKDKMCRQRGMVRFDRTIILSLLLYIYIYTYLVVSRYQELKIQN